MTSVVAITEPFSGGGGGGGSGTVTSVDVSGGSTGLTTYGGPVTSSGVITLDGTLAVAYGGTGATNAPEALTNLGAYPAANPDGYTSNTGTVTSVSGSGTVNGITLTGSVTSSGSLALGGALSNVDLTSQVTGVLPLANGGTNATNAGTARTSLGAASSGANTDITSVTLTTGTISTPPSSGTDIVNKSYADSIASGVNFHAACQYGTTAALAANTYNNGASGVGATLTAAAVGTLTIDGYTFVTGDVGKRILVKNEVAGADNGVYTLTQAGTALLPYILTRATDYDTSGSGTNEIDAGDLLLILYGTSNANTAWVQQTPLPITVGTTAIAFIQFSSGGTSYTAGTGLTLSANQFSISNIGTAGNYGSASAVPVITTNAQGQVTSVTSTNIAIAGSAVSGDIAGNAGNVTGTVAIGHGGTGQTTQQSALNAIAGAVTSGLYLRGDGTNVSMSGIQAADVPTLNQNTTGTAANLSGTQTANTFYAAPNGSAGTGSFRAIVATDIPTLNQNTTGTAGNVTGVVAIDHGGTGQTAKTAAFDALSPLSTKGDLIAYDGSDNIRLPVGADTYVLTADSTATSGVKWAASTGGGIGLGSVVTTAQGWNMV